MALLRCDETCYRSNRSQPQMYLAHRRDSRSHFCTANVALNHRHRRTIRVLTRPHQTKRPLCGPQRFVRAKAKSHHRHSKHKKKTTAIFESRCCQRQRKMQEPHARKHTQEPPHTKKHAHTALISIRHANTRAYKHPHIICGTQCVLDAAATREHANTPKLAARKQRSECVCPTNANRDNARARPHRRDVRARFACPLAPAAKV